MAYSPARPSAPTTVKSLSDGDRHQKPAVRSEVWVNGESATYITKVAVRTAPPSNEHSWSSRMASESTTIHRGVTVSNTLHALRVCNVPNIDSNTTEIEPVPGKRLIGSLVSTVVKRTGAIRMTI
jgi:hypothetical protein